MTYTFAEPAPTEQLPWDELKGTLVIVRPTEIVKDMPTKMGPTDAIRASVTAVDGPHAGKEWGDGLVFPRVLQGQLRPNLGKQVLGRVDQGPAEASKSPPWILTKATNADLEAAAKFLADQAAGQLTADDI